MATSDPIGDPDPVGAWSQPIVSIDPGDPKSMIYTTTTGTNSISSWPVPGMGHTSGIPSTMGPMGPPGPQGPPGAVTVVAPEHTEYLDGTGKQVQAEQIVSDPKEMARIAKWVGARVYPTTGLRVPTLEGVTAAFIGDWIVVDEDGIVEVYDNTDFSHEFKRRT